MAPAKTAARSRRTRTYSWSNDASSPVRPVYQWPDHPESSSDLSDADHWMSPTSLGNLYEGDESDSAGVEQQRIDNNTLAASSRTLGGHLHPHLHLGRKINFDSDSCLTPRSRRTLRRTLTGAAEPWPSVTTPAQPALDTIYSPTHEILHPMQSLLRLEKSLSTAADGTENIKPLVSRTFTPTRMTQSADFDIYKSHPSKFESYTSHEAQVDAQRNSAATGGDALQTQNVSCSEARASKNIVVLIVDAEKQPTKFAALDWAINVAVQPGDEIVILGVLKHVPSPMGYKLVANTDPVVGVRPELLQAEVKKVTHAFEQKLSDGGRRTECEKKNVKLTVRIAPGARARTVIVRELAALKATYAVFDRRVMRGTRYYNKHLSCHAVRMRSNGRSTKTIFTMTPKMPTSTTPSYSSSSPTSDTSGSGWSSSPSPTYYFWRRFAPFKSSRNKSGNKWTPTTAPLSPRNSTASTGTSTGASSETVASSLSTAAIDTATVTNTNTSLPTSLELDSFMSAMHDFSISLDRPASKGADLGTNKQAGVPAKVALQSCVVADAYSYKQGMDSLRNKHRPISVTIPPICAT